MSEACAWCGAEVPDGDGYRAAWPERGLAAVFCRLEHLVPWGIRGFEWQTAPAPVEPPAEAGPECARCGAELGGAAVYLTRHRGDLRIPDGFCGQEHLHEWAKAGGRWTT